MPTLNVPASSTSISVSIIDAGTIAKVPVNGLYSPPIPGLEHLNPAPSFAFLLEHPSGSKLLFDLGVPKVISVLGDQVLERLKNSSHEIMVDKDVPDRLGERGIPLVDINAVIWSHTHWDHKGQISAFPASTDLVVGPGVTDCFINGSGNSGIGGIEPGDIKERKLRELSFDDSQSLRIGSFRAFDYFGDGSLYLLDAPGHSVGHLCALVRTTIHPDTFMFLGGDAAHHCAEFRPSAFLPMPSSVLPNPMTMAVDVPYCPGSWFEDINIKRGRDQKGPIFQPKWAFDMDETLQTIGKMQECDADEAVFVVLAHDASLRNSKTPFFPDTINDWQARGLGKDMKWAWIQDIMNSLTANTDNA